MLGNCTVTSIFLQRCMTHESLKSDILQLVERYSAERWVTHAFRPGIDSIRIAETIFDAEEIAALVNVALDFALVTGEQTDALEKALADYIGVNYAMMTNSGSSANLLAVTALTSPLLRERQLKPGDEVITAAACFPTTVNPIVQNGLIPVFVDSTFPSCNIDVAAVERAITPRTKAIMFAHALGNPADLDALQTLVKKHHLWLVEDNCDALGSTYKGKKTGSFSHLSTVSFYPAHHMTTGEGGVVLTDDPLLKKIVESLRDWGRDCWCQPGKENTCGMRFGWQWKNLPEGYDHKYTYSHIGYNMRMTDLQAAIGVAQMQKLPSFVEKRMQNAKVLRGTIADLEEFFILPTSLEGAEPSWFGFPLTVRNPARLDRIRVTAALEKALIATRPLFAGNIIKQPAYQHVTYRIAGSLETADRIMRDTFWVGIHPGLTEAHLSYMAEHLHAICKESRSKIPLV